MSVRWSRLAGDTERFAISLSLLSDPDHGRGADPDVAASWGALSLWADGINLTAHTDGAETHEAISWYLLPLLEWAVSNWDPLLHEERLPCRVAADDAAASLDRTAFPPSSADGRWEDEWGGWWRRHAIQRARHGGPFPDVVFRRWRESIEVSWRNVMPAGVPSHVRFLATSGAARLDPALVSSALFEVVRDAARQLLHERPDSARLGALVRTAESLKSDAKRATRTAWLAGLGRGSAEAATRYRAMLDDVRGVAPALARFFEPSDGTSDLVVTGSCHGTLLFGSSSPAILPEDVLVVAEAMSDASSRHQRVELDRLVRSVPVGMRRKAWEQGVSLAEGVRETLGYEPIGLPDEMAEVLRSLGVAVFDRTFSDKTLRAVSFAGDGLGPTTIVNAPTNTTVARRRFTLAHELCHLLFDRDHGARLAIASGVWAPKDVERRANAFAAAFLMPEEAVARSVREATAPISEMPGIEQVSSALRASRTATIERLHDLGYLDDAEQDILKESLLH